MCKLVLKSGKTSVISANDRGLLTRIALCISECMPNHKWEIQPKGDKFELTVSARISGPRLQSIINTQCNPDAIELVVL